MKNENITSVRSIKNKNKIQKLKRGAYLGVRGDSTVCVRWGVSLWLNIEN
jgi:hypothetical protein